MTEDDRDKVLDEANRIMTGQGGSPRTTGKETDRGWGAYSESKPLVSQNAGIHREQVAEFNAKLAGAGITGAKYRPSDGKLEFTSRGERKRALKVLRLCDLDGGYGD